MRDLVTLSALCALSALHCGFGEVVTGGENCPEGCPPGQICNNNTCVDPSEGCEGIVCPPDQRCVLGECRSDDPCEGIDCPPGTVCQGGECISDAIDSDFDGFPAGDDCDDTNPTVFPGSEEICDGIDQDCDGDIDEGFDDDVDGYTQCGGGAAEFIDCLDTNPDVNPGAEEVCNNADDNCDGVIDDVPARPCSTPCGEGDESCMDGEWVCDAPETCECVPPDEDTEVCGSCGTRTRSCGDDYSWGAWSACAGEGVCSAGSTDSDDCGDCGRRTRTCTSACSWGAWGACTGEGECSPGATDGGACDRCSYQVCNSSCHWGSCVLRPGSECEHQAGSNWRCCGTSRWQFCLGVCVWSTDCVTCSSCC